MFNQLFKKVFGTKHDRQMKRMQPTVQQIMELSSEYEKLSDDDLRAKTAAFRERYDRGEPLDDMLVEAYATVREAAWRTLQMRHYECQLIGGMGMHQGMICEMKTGEGKTLTATTAMYLNAIPGKGAHLITVNDYLASRDAEWMGRIYGFLGMTVGTIVNGMYHRDRQKAYRCDITYGTNNEFGFDYLRDNMKETIEKYAQRPLNFAIVDEIDSILIDEARTPLIISGESSKPAETYITVDRMMPSLRRDLDFMVDEKANSVQLTDAGVDRVEKLLECGNLYDARNAELLHHVNQALRAHVLYKKDVQYLVENGNVVIIDEFTGRKMPGRRWSDGLHQAIEAKENVRIQPESRTLATITYQNYFRMYNKLAGMTGTADTEAEEFHKIYGLEVLVVPTNKPIAREDLDDLVYKNEIGKFKACVQAIRDAHERGQPVLVGTASVEKSHVIHTLLDRAKIPHNVLNAKQHGREAQVVAQAGRKHAVTVATNMAGRGTDIVLGGNAEMMARGQIDPDEDPEGYERLFRGLKTQCEEEKKEVLELGGLFILGTERHESRRIDNQLRGRAGRQGDPGRSQFYLSLEDDLMRIFGADRITGLMERLGMEDDVPIEANLVNRAIENAQTKVEAMHFDTRKNLFEYDNVMNEQRKAIYALRKQILEGRYVPEILDDEARKEAKEGALPPPPDSSGKHTVKSLGDEVREKINAIIDSYSARLMEKRDEEPSGDRPFPSKGVVAHELSHEFYRHYGAFVPLEDIRKDRDAIEARAIDVVANSLIQQRERILDLSYKSVGELVDEHCPEDVHPDEWALDDLAAAMKKRFDVEVDLSSIIDDVDEVEKQCWKQVESLFEKKEEEFGLYTFLFYVRQIYLKEIDEQWIAHLKNIEHLRTGIGLVGYATRDPKNEYKIRGFNLFKEMWDGIEVTVLDQVLNLSLSEEDRRRAEEGAEYESTLTREMAKREQRSRRGGAAQVDKLQAAARRAIEQIQAKNPEARAKAAAQAADDAAKKAAASATSAGSSSGGTRMRKVGRNDPCPCGSGKRYKECHGKKAKAAAAG